MHAACFGMGGVILLLLLGTEILEWYWVPGLVVAGLIAGLWRAYRRIPSRYMIAQGIDRRLALADTLSTAWFYSRVAPGKAASVELREAQRAEAERVAGGVSLARAVPFAAPRSLYAMAVLDLAVSGLFALRYGISERLDLRPPISKLLLDIFHFGPQQVVAKNEPKKPPLPDLLKEAGLSLGDQDQSKTGPQEGLAQTITEGEQAEEAARQQRGEGRASEAEAKDEKPGDPLENSTSGFSLNSDQSQANSKDRPGEGAGNRKSGGNAGKPKESNSLLDKFRDAMANLLSRLKSPPRQQDAQQAGAQQRNDLGQPGQSQGQKGAQMAGKSSEGTPQGEGQGEQPGDGSQESQSGPGKQGGRDAEQTAREGRTGIGKEDGSKEVREAEQLAAMGKISQIIGKRSQNLTGEVMVEVASGTQQLRTPYSSQRATHVEAGGEIHRDEIPLAFQRYVQQYFEQIRKTAPPPARAQEPGAKAGARR